MKIQQIRNATMRINYGGVTILTDPYLADKHTMISYTGKEKSLLVDLPVAKEKVIQDINCCLLSHLHSDHFDLAAR